MTLIISQETWTTIGFTVTNLLLPAQTTEQPSMHSGPWVGSPLATMITYTNSWHRSQSQSVRLQFLSNLAMLTFLGLESIMLAGLAKRILSWCRLLPRWVRKFLARFYFSSLINIQKPVSICAWNLPHTENSIGTLLVNGLSFWMDLAASRYALYILRFTK